MTTVCTCMPIRSFVFSYEPVDCVPSSWSSWAPCSLSCGGGTHNRTRSYIIAPSGGGDTCPLSQSQQCNMAACPVDCEVDTWQSWGSCTSSCGTATRSRSRSVTTTNSSGGVECPVLQDSTQCVSQPICNTDCGVGGWTAWAPECSLSCGVGGQTTRSCMLAIHTCAHACAQECTHASAHAQVQGYHSADERSR